MRGLRSENFRNASVSASKMIMPPIVGVPLFFRCDCGPSISHLLPEFQPRSSGMSSGPSSTANTKETPSVNNIDP